MYDRRLDGRVLRMGHAGMLYENSFVMYDHQTDSLWIHVTGEAFFGPLKGKKLAFIPSTVTTWEKWRERYPHTLVLPGRRRETFMGVYDGFHSLRNLGLSVVVRFRAKLYPLETLALHPLLNDVFLGQPVLVVYSDRERTATAWSRTVEHPARGRLDLRFVWSPRRDSLGNRLLEDRETGSVWSWLTGEAVSGILAGTRLPQLTYNPILIDRFRIFYPGAPVYAPGDSQ